ncbi:MAG: hypothetical protein LC745_00410, partial [Planctomycetia bacterium]|nr:hypothetical protein [Planctomycetia bacterium]
VVAGQSATVTWIDTNLGTAPAVDPWHDTISLVPNPGPDQTVIHAADVPVAKAQTLGPGASANFSATITVPGALPNSSFVQVVADATGDVFEGTNRGNNASLSVATTALTLPALAVGPTPAAGVFAAEGQSDAYEITPAPGKDVLISLASDSPGAVNELYAAHAYLR